MTSKQAKPSQKLVDFAKTQKKLREPWITRIPELDEILEGYAQGVRVSVIHAWLRGIYGDEVPSVQHLGVTLKQVRDDKS